MGQVNITLNGRDYTIACDDGEEGHLMHIADIYRSNLDELAPHLGHVGETMLMLLSGLMVTDKFDEAQTRIAELEQEIQELKSSSASNGEAQASSEQQMVDFANATAEKLEAIAVRLESA